MLAALKSPEADVRAQAARALGERRDKAAGPPLVALLKDDDPPSGSRRSWPSGRIGDGSAVPALLPLLTDPDRYLAFSTRQALRRIGDWHAVAIGLDSDDPRLRAAVLATLELVYNGDAVALLRQVASGPKAPEVERARALTELATVHRKAPEWDGKWWGTRPSKGKPPEKTIAWEATPSILETIEASLGDPTCRSGWRRSRPSRRPTTAAPCRAPRPLQAEREPAVRQEIAMALGSMGDKDALPLLVAALRDPSNPRESGRRPSRPRGDRRQGGDRGPDRDPDEQGTAGREAARPSHRRPRPVQGEGGHPRDPGRLTDPTAEIRAASAEALGKIGVLKDVAPKLRAAAQRPERRRPQGRHRRPGRTQRPRRDPRHDQGRRRRVDPVRGDARPGQAARRPGAPGLPPRGGRPEPGPPQGVLRARSRSIRDKAEPVLEQLAARRELAPRPSPSCGRSTTSSSRSSAGT